MNTSNYSLKYVFILLFFVHLTTVRSQEQDFNKLSVEANFGFGKPITPYAPKYFSSKDNSYFAFNAVNHFDVGVRYMFSSRFGLRFGVESVAIKNASGSSSLPFETQLYRTSVQGVMNLGRVLQFDEFTSRIGLLVHGGLQVSRLKVEEGFNRNKVDTDGGFVIGITPLIKLADHFAFSTDFSFSGNFRQHLNWDGSYVEDRKNLFGIMHDLTFGITYYIGKNTNHADWYWNDRSIIKTQKMEEYEAKIKELEEDSDKDGIPDHLDLEKNTKFGAVVDSKGRTITYDKPIVSGTPVLVNSKESEFKAIFENANNEIFFDFNQVNPNKDSKRKILEIILYMKKYPETKAVLNGYTDNKGGDDFNKRLALRRSLKIKEIMSLYGVAEDRISLVSKGIDELISAEGDVSALALARRVVIVIE
ncbi:MAG: hypothetical protein RL427_112 [Bacteroidota bacterium]